MYCFVFKETPKTYNWWIKYKSDPLKKSTYRSYQTKLRDAFQRHNPGVAQLSGELYGFVYYYHYQRANRIDADNLSKPIWDALEQLAYQNDNSIKFRTAAIYHHGDFYRIDDFTKLPLSVAEEFYECFGSHDFVYVEIGQYKDIGKTNDTLFKVGI